MPLRRHDPAARPVPPRARRPRRLAALGLGLALLAGPGCRPSGPAPGDLVVRDWLSSERPLTAFAFLSTECPLSQNYTRQLNELDAGQDALDVIGIFPLVDDDEPTVDAFRETYGVRFQTRLDHDYELVQALRPTITPEVFLLDGNAHVIYSGKIDNWAVELGRTRRKPTEHYLLDAVQAHLAGEKVALRRVEPVGCFLPQEPDGARGE